MPVAGMCCSGVSVSPGAQLEQGGQRLGALGCHPCRRVPPQHVRLVAGEDLARLRHGDGLEILVEGSLVGFVPALALLHARLGAARMGPVLGLRVVEAELEPFLAGGLGQRTDQILAVGCGVGDVPTGHVRGEKRGAVVVLRGDDHVAHAGVAGELGPFLRLVFHRVEILGIPAVGVDRDLGAPHDPLADALDGLAFIGAGGHRIDAPVDEHAELGVPPPRHPGVALGGIFVGGRIGRSRDNGQDGRQRGSRRKRVLHGMRENAESGPGVSAERRKGRSGPFRREPAFGTS